MPIPYIADGNVPLAHATVRQAATSIVAASDSLHRERADYVCDGVDDNEELNAAQDDLVTIKEIFTKSGSNPLTGLSNYGCVWYDDGDNKYYYYNPISDATPMKRYLSSDGVTFALDGTTNINTVVPRVWKEAGTWYMLYRAGATGIYAASSADGMTWTVLNSGNVVLDMTEDWETTEHLDPSGVIKVDDTYYLFYNHAGKYPRQIGYATSTDLINWTKYTKNPIFEGNRFCVDLFKYGGYYYMVVPHYSGYHIVYPGAFEELELWRCPTVTFHPEEREFLAVVMRLNKKDDWDNGHLDTPTIAVTNIQKTEFPNNRLECYYEAGSAAKIGLAIAALEDIPSQRGHMGGVIALLSGHYNTSEIMFLRENAELCAKGAVIFFSGATTTEKAAIMPSDKTKISGIKLIDLSEEEFSRGIYIRDSSHVKIDNVCAYNFGVGIAVNTECNKVSNSLLSRSKRFGIVADGRLNEIEFNTIENFESGAIDVRGDHLSVVHNLFTRGIVNASYIADVYIRHVNHAYFADNKILFSTKNHGISVYSDCEDDTVQILNNEITSTITNPITLNDGVKCLIENNIGYITKKSGTSTGTGAQQTIAHGLAATPTKVILWNIEDGANPYQSAAADATNIYILAVINQDYGWEAEVV